MERKKTKQKLSEKFNMESSDLSLTYEYKNQIDWMNKTQDLIYTPLKGH